MRIVLENLVLFLLPTAAYLGFAWLTRPGNGKSVWDGAPLYWLFGAGAMLVIVTLVVFGSTSGGKPGQIYVPPESKDGKITPGHFR